MASSSSEAAADEAESVFACCRASDVKELQRLLQGRNRVFVNCVDTNGDTPLHACAGVECARLLLQHLGAASLQLLNRQNRDGDTALCAAVINDRPQLAEFFIDNGADVRVRNKQFQTVLHLAACCGCVQLVARLLSSYEVDVDQADRTGSTPLHYAAQYSSPQAAEQLVEMLLQHQPNLSINCSDTKGRTAFALAAQAGNVATCRLLLAAEGCDVNESDSNGAGPLHAAAAAAAPAMLQFLVEEAGTGVNQVDNIGRTALFYAVAHSRADCVAKLLQLQADPNIRTELELSSALHCAAKTSADACLSELGRDDRTELLLRDSQGRTALHVAAAAGSCSTVELLLQLMRRRGVVNGEVIDSAADLAAKYRYRDVVDLLSKAQRGGTHSDDGHEGNKPIEENSPNKKRVDIDEQDGDTENDARTNGERDNPKDNYEGTPRENLEDNHEDNLEDNSEDNPKDHQKDKDSSSDSSEDDNDDGCLKTSESQDNPKQTDTGIKAGKSRKRIKKKRQKQPRSKSDINLDYLMKNQRLFDQSRANHQRRATLAKVNLTRRWSSLNLDPPPAASTHSTASRPQTARPVLHSYSSRSAHNAHYQFFPNFRRPQTARSQVENLQLRMLPPIYSVGSTNRQP